ncbi:MAG: DUF4190 domain-containing protein [Phycisphaerales bacterium]
MTVRPPPPPPGPSAKPADRYSTSAILSVVALVLPLVGPLIAIVLATGALARIRRSEATRPTESARPSNVAAGPRLRGRRIAYVGLGLGAILLIAEFSLLDAFARSTTEHIDNQIASALTDVFGVATNRDADAVLERWSRHAEDRITREQLLAFATSARERYGGFRSVSVVARDDPDYSFTRQAVSTAVAYRFENGDRMGSLVMLLEPDPESLLRPIPRLAEIIVDDRALGTLRLGPKERSVEAAPSAPSQGNGGANAG